MAPTIQQKVERLKEELGLDAGLSIKDAIQEANNLAAAQRNAAEPAVSVTGRPPAAAALPAAQSLQRVRRRVI